MCGRVRGDEWAGTTEVDEGLGTWIAAKEPVDIDTGRLAAPNEMEPGFPYLIVRLQRRLPPYVRHSLPPRTGPPFSPDRRPPSHRASIASRLPPATGSRDFLPPGGFRATNA